MNYTNPHITAAMKQFNVCAKAFRWSRTKQACDARTTAVRSLRSEGWTLTAIAKVMGQSHASSARQSMNRVLT